MADHFIRLNLPRFGYGERQGFASIVKVPEVFSKKNPELYSWRHVPLGPMNTHASAISLVLYKENIVRSAIMNVLFDDIEGKSFRLLHIIYLILHYNIYDNMFFGYHPLWLEVSQKWQIEILHRVVLECMEKAVQAPSDLKSLEDCVRRQLEEDLNDHLLQSQSVNLQSQVEELLQHCKIRRRRKESWEAKPEELPQQLEELLKFRNACINELKPKSVSALDHLVVEGVSGEGKLDYILFLIDHWLKSSYRDFLFNLNVKIGGYCPYDGHGYSYSILPGVQQQNSSFENDLWSIRFRLGTMLADAAYILDGLLAMLYHETGNSSMNHSLRIADMYKMENQVPLLLLRIVFAGLFNFPPDCFEAFLAYSCSFLIPFRFDQKRRLYMPHGFKENFHLLHCIREMVVVMTGEPEVEDETCFHHRLFLIKRLFCWPNIHPRFFVFKPVLPSRSLFVPHTVELSKAGIKFKASDTAGIRNVRFCKNTSCLYLPQIVIRDSFETFWRNLAVFENVFYAIHGGSFDAPIVSFLYLMDDLIDSSEDVKLLRKHDIIITNLGDEKVAQLFNSLTDSLGRGSYQQIDSVVAQISDLYAQRKWRILWSEFVETYFKKPWLLISAVTATCFLLIQTVLQILSSFSGQDKLKLG